jgi:integrase/recombinase XerD
MTTTTLLPFQPDAMTPAQLAAVSYLARYSGQTHTLYACQLRRWFVWCEASALEPLVGIQRAHVELYIPHLGECGLMPSSVNTMMHAVRGFFRFAHIDGLIGGTPPLPTPSTRAPRDAQILARHADPRTTEHYDRARGNLDRHGVHFLTADVAGV